MDDARLRRRILVVVVTTRAAASSLRPTNGQARAAVLRGIALLDSIAEEVKLASDPGATERVDQAGRELESLLAEVSA